MIVLGWNFLAHILQFEILQIFLNIWLILSQRQLKKFQTQKKFILYKSFSKLELHDIFGYFSKTYLSTSNTANLYSQNLLFFYYNVVI